MSDSTRRPFRCFSYSAGIHPQEEERRTVKLGGELRMLRRDGRSSLVEIRGIGLQGETNGSKLGIVLWDNSGRKRWPGGVSRPKHRSARRSKYHLEVQRRILLSVLEPSES